MKRNVFVFGSIAGLIVTAVMAVSATWCVNDPDFEGSMVLGFGSMLVAFAFIFIGIKNYRDKQNGGIITFGKAFTIGLLIALVASTIYVLTWLVEYYCFIPDFMEKYAAHVIKKAQESGVSGAALEKQIADMESQKEMYKNPVWVILFTYMEIFPLGLVVALISALILKRKVKKEPAQVV